MAERSGNDAASADRRALLKGLATGGLAIGAARAAVATETAPAKSVPGADPAAAAISEHRAPDAPDPLTADHSGSDFMIDVIKTLDIEYVAANPGSSFRGLHESLINYGGNTRPELLTCLHEESAVAIAAGYARARGKPMAAFIHATVGVQHASMSVYHAFADRAPVLLFCGNTRDAATRRPFVEWLHSAQDNAAILRDCLKWDDQPVSLAHFAESTVRAYRLATSVPMGPVMIAVDSDLQEEPLERKPPLPHLAPRVPPVADPAALEALARLLVDAKAPALLADRYAESEAGMARLIELAELLGAPVVDLAGRFNFPTDHPLNHSGRARAVEAGADVILALEPIDLWGSLNSFRDQLVRRSRPIGPEGQKIAVIGMGELLVHANYQDFQRYVGADLSITGDAENSLPPLIATIRRLQSGADRHSAAARAKSLGDAHAALRERDRRAARLGWDASPITTARLCSEVWDVIRHEDFVVCGATLGISSWPDRLWTIDKPYQYVKGIGAAGIGVNIGLAVGIALAHREAKRIVVNFQTDGDLLYAPGALWTAAHHRIPLLTVMHNNQAYHQELMHIQRMANRHERGVERAAIGTVIDDPAIDFASIARGLGVWAEGPIDDPAALAPALRRALAEVKQGKPALLDVRTQAR